MTDAEGMTLEDWKEEHDKQARLQRENLRIAIEWQKRAEAAEKQLALETQRADQWVSTAEQQRKERDRQYEQNAAQIVKIAELEKQLAEARAATLEATKAFAVAMGTAQRYKREGGPEFEPTKGAVK